MHVFRPAALGVALMAAVGMANAAPDVPTADARGVAISEAAYPGTIVLEVDATDLGQRVFKVRQSVPVQPGVQRFHYPAWLPGKHSPSGAISARAACKKVWPEA